MKRYVRWLHTGWPAGKVEKLPDVREDGTTSIPGVRVTGDLTGIPLLKFSADSGAKAVRAIADEADFEAHRGQREGVLDLAIVGAGVSGIAAAVEAQKAGLSFEVYEASEPFSTIVDFPKGKPIFTFPTEMTPAGDFRVTAEIKEELVEKLERQRREAGIEPVRARIERLEKKGDLILLHRSDGAEPAKALRAIVAIGRSGNFRKLNVPGEDLDKVYNRLHDPKDFADSNALVVGGGDSALETAIALATCGARVTLSYRGAELSRPKPDNVERLEALVRNPEADIQVEEPSSERVSTAVTSEMMKPRPRRGSVHLLMETEVREIRDDVAVLAKKGGGTLAVENDVVFSMIGREPPLDFFRRSKVRIRGEWTPRVWLGFLLFVGFCVFLYLWKAGGSLTQTFREHSWFPFNVPGLFDTFGTGIRKASQDPSHLLGTLRITLDEPGFYYALAYCVVVVVFGVRRIRRRRTPYVTRQTVTLMAFQLIPLFLLPYVVLPWMGHNGLFDGGALGTVADGLFPVANYGHGREYWRAFGLILAWPLFVYNLFTHAPLVWWIVLSIVQTFVVIPLIVWRWGKGAYCGWICSCGALAETLGDRHRHKMPHGPLWNRLNMVGQVILLVAFVLLIGRTIIWIWPESRVGQAVGHLYHGMLDGWSPFGIPLNYHYVVDVTLAGIIGLGFYFWFSGRVWCRFACPLAALMHIYARFSRFRIFADKKKCISCNVCTSVCHQGIDVMNFANKGLQMKDPECVRCSACVQSCPTGVLTFGRFGRGGRVIYDQAPASLVQMAESRADVRS